MKKLLPLLLFCLSISGYLNAQTVTIANLSSSGTDDCIDFDPTSFYGQVFTAIATGDWTSLALYIGTFSPTTVAAGQIQVYVDNGEVVNTTTSTTKLLIGSITSANGISNFTFNFPVEAGKKYAWWVEIIGNFSGDFCYQVANTVFGEANDYLHAERENIGADFSNSGQVSSATLAGLAGGKSALFSLKIENTTILDATDQKATDLSAVDPCSCSDPKNTTVGGDFLFHDILTVTSAAGESIWLSANDGEFRDANNMALPAGALPTSDPGGNAGGTGTGTLIPETTTPGTYQLEFYHRTGISSTISYTNGGMTKSFNSSNCTICLPSIPSLSQWGLLILGLLLLNLSIGIIYRKRLI